MAACTLQAKEPAKPPQIPADDQLTQLAEALLGKNGGDKLFYVPTHDFPQTPKDAGLKYEDATFDTADGVKLHGWFLPSAKPETLGTVVYSHGNAGSVAYHIGGIEWLVKAGYAVFMYDYRGYGKSAGQPDREGTLKDMVAALAYVRTRPDVDKNRVVAFGHSLGGAVTLSSLSRNGGEGVKAVMTVGAFASYQDMAESMAKGLGRNMVSDDLSPVGLIGGLKVPVLLLHGDNDPMVPIAQGRKLFDAAKGDKEFISVPEGGHMEVFDADNGAFRQNALKWLAKRLR